MAEEKKRHKGWKIAGWTIGILLLLVVALPLSLYIPWVQNVVKDFACEYASKKTGMDISVGRILVKFPLDVSVDDVLIIDQQGDTMLQAGNLTADIAFKPLLDKQVVIDGVHLKQGRYAMTTDDESMALRVDVDQADIDDVDVDLNGNNVKLGDARLKGGNVTLSYLPYKVVEEEDTSATEPWRVQAKRIVLDDIDYKMDMLPTIDNMAAHVTHAELHDGKVDTGAKTVDVGGLQVDSADVRYIYPTEKFSRDYTAAHPPVQPDSLKPAPMPQDSVPWTVKVDSLRLNGGHAVYAQLDAKTSGKGLDMNYIEVKDLNFAVDSFYNRGTDITVPVKSLTARERSGLEIKHGSGTVRMDGLGIDLDNIDLATGMSTLKLDGHIDQALIENRPEGIMHVKTDSKIAVQEVAMAMPSLAETIKDIPQSSPITIKGDVAGNTRQVDIRTLTLDMPQYAHASVSGKVYNPADPKKLAGEIDLDGHFDNINWVKPTLMDKAMQRDLNLPPMDLKGHLKLAGDEMSGNAVMTTGGGKLVVGNAVFNSKSEKYDIDATLTDFPVKAILPGYDVDHLTGHIRAKGNGFDFLNPNTDIDADIDLRNVSYKNSRYGDITAKVDMNGGLMNAHLASNSGNCNMDLNVAGTIDGRHYVVDAEGRIDNVDLKALGLTKTASAGKGIFTGHADVDLDAKRYDADFTVNNLDWTHNGQVYVADRVDVDLNADNSHVDARFVNEDNNIVFRSECGMDTFIDRFKRVGDLALDQYKHRSLDIDTLKQTLPKFELDATMGPDGLIQRYLAGYDIDFREVTANVRNDSNIYANARVRSLTYGKTNIDTITFNATEWNKYLKFEAHMGNRPGTWDDMAQVTIEGGVIGSTVDFLLKQSNIKRETGYKVGVNATLADSIIKARLFPETPIIGYRSWNINKDNYVNFNYNTRMFDADLQLSSGESKILMLTEREPYARNEKIKLDIDKLKIEEWTQLFPTLPKMTGELNADLNIDFDGKNADGDANIALRNFTYNGMREGNIDLIANYKVDPATASTRLNADLLMDGNKVAVAFGSLNDSTATNPYNLTLQLDRFPLRRVSPFIPGEMIRLRGYANGSLALTGSTRDPHLTGAIAGDSAFITIPRYGASLRLADDSIRVNDNLLRLKDYRIYGANENPVTADGTVDLRDFDNMKIDLALKGRNVQAINSEQRGFSEIFGKGFIDLDATVKARDGKMNIRADVSLLPTSNLTYVMKDEVALSGQQIDENMVTFTDLSDSTSVSPNLITAAAKTATDILVSINVEEGSKLAVYLSEDGNDRANIQGSGKLRYTLDFAGKSNLNGTYTIENGNLRYTPPLIAQKDFEIASGSSLVWTGDMLNPTLKLTGTERLKTSVTGSDNATHLVEFLITANVGGTLSNIDLNFDLSSEGDMSVQNEIQSMSANQRSQAAINLLLYNTYSGTNSAGTINNMAASAALFSFLQSKLNAWAGKAIKGVDISFGINQYEGTRSGGTETSYSYRLSKSLFNERFKIVVGGEYSTDATAEENFSQNLISDISFEYLLNDAGSKYLRLFRHTGYESMLEGRVTKTGVGFVLKRKVDALNHMFRSDPKPQVVPTDTIPDDNDEQPPLDSVGLKNDSITIVNQQE